MLWFFAEDNIHYSEKNIKSLINKYNLEKIIPFPTKEDIKKYADNNKIAFIAPFYPNAIGLFQKNTNFLNIIRLENKYEPFTSSQIEFNLPKDKILEQNLGIKVIHSNLTFKNYIGAEKLIEEAKIIELKMLNGLNPKGLFLVGLPGTGKSFFTKCFAGETKRLLLELNFSKILEDEKPLDKLTMIINYLQNNPAKYLVWIDEIEKMFSNDNSQQILGTFLTELNEFNSAKSNALFIATANNINELSFKNPELFRSGGRFDKIIALLPPTESNAIKILEYYFNVLKEKFMWNNFLNAFLTLYYPDEFKYYYNTNIFLLAEKFKKEFENNPLLKDVYKNINNIISLLYELIFNLRYDLIYKDNFISKIVKDDIIKQIKVSDNTEEKFILFKNIFKEAFEFYYKNTLTLQKTYDDFIENNFFQTKDKIQNIIYKIITQYRDKSALKERFPYTQAEISTFSNTLYSNYYFYNYSLDKSIEKTIKEIIPLQVQMNEQITKMAKSLENFLTV